MMDLPLELIKKKIIEESGLSEKELDQRIKKKLDELAGLISKEGAAHIIANELKVRLHEPGAPLTVERLTAGQRNVELVGKVQKVFEVRTFTTERRSGKVGNIELADQTGTTRVVFWNDQADIIKDLKPGDILALKNAYVRSNQGRVELHCSESTGITINPKGVKVDVDITHTTKMLSPIKKIKELTAQDQNVTIIATVVQIFEPKFFPACPECNSRTKEESGGYLCPSHGQVQPKFNSVMNLYLDDGSDNIRCVLWREQAAKLLDKTEEEMLFIKDTPSSFEPFKTDLLGVIVKVRGRVNNNEAFGRLELVAYEVDKDVDPEGNRTKETIEREETTIAIDEHGKQNTIAKTKSTITAQENLYTLEDIEDLEDLE